MKTYFFIVSALLGSCHLVHSASFAWDGGIGNWNAANWNTGGSLPDTDPADSYVSNGDDVNIGSGTVSTDERILLDAGTITVSGGASLTVDSTGSLSAMNLGSAGTAGHLVITGSTANFIGSGGSGRSVRAQNGSSISITDSIVDVSSTGSNGSLEMEAGTTVTIAGTSNVSMNYLRLDSGAGGMMTMSSGTLTLSYSNPLRSSSGFNGQFNLTGAAGSLEIIHTDLTSTDTNHHLAGKLAGPNPGLFAIDGTVIDPATAYNGVNLAAVNADLATNWVVGGRFIQVTEAAGQQTLILTDTPVGPGGSLTTAVIPALPNPNLAQNPIPPGNSGSTKVAAGNSKAQSFSLAGPADLTAFVIQLDSITTTGDYTLTIYRSMDGLPWLPDPVFSDSGTLPASAVAGDLIQIDLPSPVALDRGSYAIALTGIGATDFNLTLSNDDLFPAGAGTRNSTSTNGWEYLTTPTADLVFAALGTKGTPDPAPPANAPNIIFILTDDYGWTDVQAGPTGPNVLDGVNYGSSYYQTPTLARLAAEGLSFTHCFAQPNCAPTRAAILSGQYPCRSGNGVYHVDGLNRGNGTPFYRGPSQNEDIPASHTILAEALQAGGYVTAHLGKYHVGFHEGGQSTSPENNGFDFNFGGTSVGNPGNYHANNQIFGGNINNGLDLYAKDYNSSYINDILTPIANTNNPSFLLNNTLNGQNDEKHVEDALGDAAIAFMTEVRNGELSDRPFYLQLHPYAVHTPIGNSQARADLLQKYQGITSTDPRHNSAPYGAINEAIDQTLLRILNYLEDPDGDGDQADSIVNNTLIVFTSDNGGHIGPTDNDPLRFRKGSFYNGGIRVPLIVWQPGTIPAASQSDTLVHSVDFFPTLVEHAGLNMPNGITYDGESFASHMDDPVTNPRERSPIFYHFPGYLDQRARPCDVVIKRVDGETYKLIYTYDTNYDGNPSGNENTQEGLDPLSDPWELFAFDSDLSEINDLSNNSYSNSLLYQEIADGMAADLDTWLTQNTPGWQPSQITVRSSGASVPFPPSSTPVVTVPLNQSFRISSSSIDSDTDNVTLTWNSELTFSYDIQASSDLSNWDPMASDIPAQGASTTHTFTDNLAGTETKRFYRIILKP